MKANRILFIATVIALSLIALPHFGYTQNNDPALIYPKPTVELTYINEPFTKDLIIQKSFRDNQLVPVKIELVKPPINDDLEKDLYPSIESVRVLFAIHEDAALRTATHPGHLIIIPISWPQGFALEQGSRLVFVVKYNYRTKNEVIEKGEIIEQIRF
jgi:hypothetical protein